MRKIACIGVVALTFAQASPAFADSAPAGWQAYTDAKLGYSISYPQDWKTDPNFVSVSLGPDHEIKGVAFVIPQSMTLGTNLEVSNTEMSVESIAGRNCTAPQFVNPAQNIHKLNADGRTYTAATSRDAAAGNRYDTMLFILDGTEPCIAVRHMIHYSAIQNYDPGTVRPFDRANLDKLFDSMRATLKLKP